ncbi:MAG: SGNH/GDSL hydrolase family protein [Verrucomicrobiota bacterium]
MKSLRALLLRVTLVIVALLVPLLAMELVLRAADLFHLKKPAPRKDRSSVDYYSEESRIHPWTGRHRDPLRIAVIGDSVTAGWGVLTDDSYGYRLERLLNLNDGQRPAEVNVYARGGTCTFTQERFVYEALRWKPDLILLGISLNDAEDMRDMERLKRWRDETMPRVPPPWLARLLRRSRACSWVYQNMADAQAQRGYLRYYGRLYDKDYSGWKVFEKSIRKFKRLCDEHEVPLVAVIMGGETKPLFLRIHRQIQELLDAERVRYLDLLEDFRGMDPTRLHVVPYLDAHPNEIAHRIIAQAIFEYLLANGLVDPGYAPKRVKHGKDEYWKRIERRMQKPLWEMPAGQVAAPGS